MSSPFSQDEQQIRNLIDAWMRASKSGDLETLMGLMADDVLFLTVGNPPMTRNDFESRFRAMQGKVKIEGSPQIQEITIHGDLALCRLFLDLTITPPNGEVIRRSGNILSSYRRGEDGKWRIWRDANLLTA
ncbi:MAG TPA: SgcJ/EcaC family oxidoreductase [Terracidiphilus sp.]|nr:SgcJ/EcaC family oxidoreductase [Terracidiphilus sp.]